MQKVLLGTPSYDGRVDVWFVDSLMNTIRESINRNIQIDVIYPSYDSLVQRARNDLVRMALSGSYDALFFIDSDVEWKPEWFFSFLERPEPMIGAALVKKSDYEGYTVKIMNKELKYSRDKKLLEVDGVGTGFLRITRFALEKLWSMSEPYTHNGNEDRMVFDIKIENGDLISEDFVVCSKWRSLGYKVWIDPTITCDHIGVKKYSGDLKKFLKNNGYV